MCKKNISKNCVNLKNWVINGPLWVKYGGKIACQPPPAQNPGHAPALCFNLRKNLFIEIKD